MDQQHLVTFWEKVGSTGDEVAAQCSCGWRGATHRESMISPSPLTDAAQEWGDHRAEMAAGITAQPVDASHL